VFIQINADNQVKSDQERDGRLEERIKDRLKRFDGRITDVELHLSEPTARRNGGGSEIRCTLEARVNGIAPVAASGDGSTAERAAIAAVDKAGRALDKTLGRLNDRH
jgi:ribosome-associated translation inhibitor RaiA